jgi:hypothetical protein
MPAKKKDISKRGKCTKGALKELLDSFILQLLPSKISIKPSIIKRDIIASTMPIINTDQNANLIM